MITPAGITQARLAGTPGPGARLEANGGTGETGASRESSRGPAEAGKFPCRTTASRSPQETLNLGKGPRRPVRHSGSVQAAPTHDIKISALETIRLDEFPNVLWVRLHTDEGLAGLGETFFGARAVEANLHESAAMTVLGRDPLVIERLSRDLTTYIGFAAMPLRLIGRVWQERCLRPLHGVARRFRIEFRTGRHRRSRETPSSASNGRVSSRI